jgi:WD40 repeat protein
MDRKILVWNLSSPRQRPAELRRSATNEIAWASALSPDGRNLAVGDAGGNVFLWDLHKRLTEPQPRQIAGKHGDTGARDVRSLAFSADGRRLAAGSDDNRIRIWNLGRTGEAAAENPIVFNTPTPQTLAFSSDGRYLAAGHFDGVTKIWHVLNPKAAPIVAGAQGLKIWAISFGSYPRSTALASADRKSVRFWSLAPSLSDAICQKVTRNLTLDEWLQFVGSDIPYEPTCASVPADAGK